jgi:hypothetical protein
MNQRVIDFSITTHGEMDRLFLEKLTLLAGFAAALAAGLKIIMLRRPAGESAHRDRNHHHCRLHRHRRYRAAATNGPRSW